MLGRVEWSAAAVCAWQTRQLTQQAAHEGFLRVLKVRRIRTCSSDTALDQLDGSDIKAQSLKHQAGYPSSPAHQSAANGSMLATPPRKHASRSTSTPPERRADNTAKLAATRHANSARISEVRPAHAGETGLPGHARAAFTNADGCWHR